MALLLLLLLYIHSLFFSIYRTTNALNQTFSYSIHLNNNPKIIDRFAAILFTRGLRFLFTRLSLCRHEEGGALGGGVDALKNLIRAGGAGCRMLTELSIRGLGLTCSSMLQVREMIGVEGLFL